MYLFAIPMHSFDALFSVSVSPSRVLKTFYVDVSASTSFENAQKQVKDDIVS